MAELEERKNLGAWRISRATEFVCKCVLMQFLILRYLLLPAHVAAAHLHATQQRKMMAGHYPAQ